MEYRNGRVDHGKVIQAEAKHMVIGKGRGDSDWRTRGITRHSRQMTQDFGVCSNLSARAPRMACGMRRILFCQVPLLGG